MAYKTEEQLQREIEEMHRELDREFVAKVDGVPITKGELGEVFDLVQTSDDWKAPIDCKIMLGTENQKDLVRKAVEFFTGTRANFELIEPMLKLYRVTAVGYRNGPCN